MDFDRLAAEVIRQMRGKRSQNAFSRRLGYRTNVVYTWEAGRRFPTAAVFLQALRRTGVDVGAALERFYRRTPAWLDTVDPTSPAGVARLLDDLRGGTAIGDLAARAGKSRFSVARFLKGTAEPRLPDFLRLIEAASLRLLDFLSELVDVTRLPSARSAWSELETARRAAYELPWSHAVLRVLETTAYRALAAHRPGYIAERLGISLEDETASLSMLAASNQIRLESGLWTPARVLTVDTRQDPAGGRRLKAWWAKVALERIPTSADGLFSYNLFTVSERDYARLRALHSNYFRELRAIVAQSEPAERVVLANVQLIALDEPRA